MLFVFVLHQRHHVLVGFIAQIALVIVFFITINRKLLDGYLASIKLFHTPLRSCPEFRGPSACDDTDW